MMFNPRSILPFIALFCSSLASRILLMPFPYTSHVGEFKHIGEALANRGHEVHIVLPSHFPSVSKFRSNSSTIKALEYEAIHPDFLTWTPESLGDMFKSMLEMTIIDDFRLNTVGWEEVCYNVLESTDLESKVKALNFDMVLVGAFPCSRCFYVFLYRLGLMNYVSVTTQYEPWLFRAPALPSFVPFPLHSPSFTPEMTFMERLSNLWTLADWIYFTTDMNYLSDDLVRKYAPDKPAVTLNHLAGRSLLWLFDTDLSIDYPRPVMANEINIGGLSVGPAKQLPKELEQFATSAKGGLIIASFGSSSSAIPEKYMRKMLDAFVTLPSDIHVVFRCSFESKPDVPQNILLKEWIPQSDLLGHPNARLFLTHCGANSQFEALYHGVPMINFPVGVDQPYNAKRGDYHGISETMDVTAFTSEQLAVTMKKMLSDPGYSGRVKHRSAIFRSQPMKPTERAAYWVEHVLTFGGDHLHSHALDMPGYQYLMLDIFALFFLIICICVLILYKTCYLLLRKCKGSGNVPVVTENGELPKLKTT